jgi:hypothetical protein
MVDEKVEECDVRLRHGGVTDDETWNAEWALSNEVNYADCKKQYFTSRLFLNVMCMCKNLHGF